MNMTSFVMKSLLTDLILQKTPEAGIIVSVFPKYHEIKIPENIFKKSVGVKVLFIAKSLDE